MHQSPLPVAGAVEFARWVLRRRRRFRVVGESMLPCLAPGQVVFAATDRPASASDVVCARHPYDPSTVVIKRVARIDDDGRLFLQSDNALAEGATDSSRFGMVEPFAILGVVTSVIATD